MIALLLDPCGSYKRKYKNSRWCNNLKTPKPNFDHFKRRRNNKTSASPVTPGLLREIAQKVVEAFRPKKIILFGSYAYGKPTSNSDLDLLVVMETRDRPAERIRKVSDLFDPRPLPMDFIVLTPGEMQHRLSGFDPFLEEVLEKGQTLYGSET